MKQDAEGREEPILKMEEGDKLTLVVHKKERKKDTRVHVWRAT